MEASVDSPLEHGLSGFVSMAGDSCSKFADEDSMTIGIAAVCDEGRSAIVAADRMSSGPNMQFDEDTAKVIVAGQVGSVCAMNDPRRGLRMQSFLAGASGSVEIVASGAAELHQEMQAELRNEIMRKAFDCDQSDMASVLANAQTGSVGHNLVSEVLKAKVGVQVALAGWSEVNHCFASYPDITRRRNG